MDNKYRLISRKELWQYLQRNNFSELFKTQPKKATDLFNDLWNRMTPYPNTQNKKILFSNTFIEWMYLVEGEIK